MSAETDGLTRPAYTPALRAAHTLVTDWMRAAGMTVYEDAAGNLVGSYPANRSAARTLIIGSHLDTVRDAGRYDCALGILVAIAAVEALRRQGRRMAYAIDVVAFADAEGLRFGHAFTGSRALTGRLALEDLQVQDANGVSLADALHEFGGDPAMLTQDARRADDVVGYVEIHIEQGPVLEAQGLALGVVSAIAGATRSQLTLRSAAEHLDVRDDAPAGAVSLSPHLRAGLLQALEAAGHTPYELPSSAGHDAGILAEFTQAGMLFVRCQDGISHHPDEAVAVEDVAAALEVVGKFLENL